MYLWYLGTNNWVNVVLCVLSMAAWYLLQTYINRQVSGLSTFRPPSASSANITSTARSGTTANSLEGHTRFSSTTAPENMGVSRANANLWAFLGLTGILMVLVAICDLFTSLMIAFSSFNIHRLMLSKIYFYYSTIFESRFVNNTIHSFRVDSL